MRVALLALLCLCGCASNSGVISMGQDTYMLSRQAATPLGGQGTVKAEALTEARNYCGSRDLEVIETIEAQPPFILGNLPRTEVRFRCIP